MIIGAGVGYFSGGRRAGFKHKLFLLATFLLMCWLICVLLQNGYINYPIDNMLYTILYLGLSVLILRNLYNHYIALALYGITIASIIKKLAQDTSINAILFANSRNYISVLLLFTLLLYYISCHDKNRHLLVTPAILYFIVSIIATGRGGIFSSGFLAIGICVYKAFSLENKYAKRLLWLVIIILTLISVALASSVSDNTIGGFLGNYFNVLRVKGITDVTRQKIWTSYVKNNHCDLLTFLVGSDTHLVRRDGNLHNSFLQAYAAFGFVGFAAIIILVLKALIQGLKNKDWLWIILYVGLILRAFTDRLFFQGYCEIFLYYFILYWDYKRKKRSSLRN